jgi:hypothetical protein
LVAVRVPEVLLTVKYRFSPDGNKVSDELVKLITATPVTVKVVVPTTPKVADIVVAPGATPVASPVALIVAINGAVDAQATLFVRLAVDPSE